MISRLPCQSFEKSTCFFRACWEVFISGSFLKVAYFPKVNYSSFEKLWLTVTPSVQMCSSLKGSNPSALLNGIAPFPHCMLVLSSRPLPFLCHCWPSKPFLHHELPLQHFSQGFCTSPLNLLYLASAANAFKTF